MTVSSQVSALIATFHDRRKAARYVNALRRAGFKENEIGVLSPETHPHVDVVEDDAVAGAISGGLVGAVAGAVATGLIPGIGPVLAAGMLASVLGGAAAGATAGTVLGALIGLGVPEDKAQEYQHAILAGRTLVAVQAVGRGGDALTILRRCEEDVKPRAEAALQDAKSLSEKGVFQSRDR